jgi:hypothetical protein
MTFHGNLQVNHDEEGNLEIKHDVGAEDPTMIDPDIDPMGGPGAMQALRPPDAPNPEIEADFGFGLSDLNPVKAVKKVVETGADVATSAAEGIEDFASTAAHTAGKAAHSMYNAFDGLTGKIKEKMYAIPVAGVGLRATVGLSEEPMRFGRAVASGRRIDRAALSSLKTTLRNTKEIAPYAQAVASFVPGVGTGLAAGIAGGVALAEGKQINEAMIEATRAALPGGPLAQAAFQAGLSATRGDSVSDIALDAAIAAAPVSEQQRGQLRGAIDIAQAAAAGKPLDDLALQAAVSHLAPEARAQAEQWIGQPGAQSKIYDQLTKNLPKSARDALSVGVAMGIAKTDQDGLFERMTDPATAEHLTLVGKEAIAKSEVLRTAASSAPDEDAFALGIGLMKQNDVPSRAVLYLRDSLPKGRQRLSFDTALSTHIGAVVSKRPTLKSAKAKVGFYNVIGSLPMGPQEQRGHILRILIKDPEEYVHR